jgi:hypothetical protein
MPAAGKVTQLHENRACCEARDRESHRTPHGRARGAAALVAVAANGR